ncbi:HDOD domain-containing protein [Thiovibrio sp. JS02]
MEGCSDIAKRQKLTEIFTKINLGEIPAISTHVQEVLAITLKKQVTAEELSRAILKDYSLTNKVLQVVNSAYYIRGVAITTIERAVTALGNDVIRELAVSISLIEEFFRSGGEKDSLSKLLALSLVSANLSRTVAGRHRLPVCQEEAYICALLHDLGRIVITLYFPEIARRIELAKASGSSEEAMCRLMLKQLTYNEIGGEVACFWNFSETIIACMETAPPAPQSPADSLPTLQNLALFANLFVRAICEEQPLQLVTQRFQNIFPVDLNGLLDICLHIADTVGGVSGVVRYGLIKLKYRSKLLTAMKKYQKFPQP